MSSEPASRRQSTSKRISTSKARSLADDECIKDGVERQCEPVMKAESVASSRMSRRSARLAEAFQAELAVMDQEDRLEALKYEQLMKLREEQRKLKELKLKNELAAKMSALEDEDDASEGDRDDIQVPKEIPGDSVRRYFDSHPDVEASAASPPHDVHQTGFEKMAESMTEMAKAMMQQNATTHGLAISSQLPKLEIPMFSGDPLRYALWKNGFTNLVDSKPLDGATKLNYLNSYVTGEPKKIVEHFILLGTEEAYLQAMELLQKRYGSGSVISAAFSNKLTSWPRIFDKDPAGLRKFADFLEQVAAAKSTESSLGILDYPQENIKLVNKLPLYLERSWRDEVDRWQTHGYGSYPPFKVFTDFVSRAANKANIPELEGLRSGESRPRQYQEECPRYTQKGKVLSTKVESKISKGNYSSRPFCEEDHHIDDCKDFKKRSLHARKGFFFQKNLCMGCGITDSHQVKDCQHRRKCKVCHGNHLASLHRFEKSKIQGEGASSNCTNVCSLPDQDGQEHCMIVPVWVRHKDEPSREFLHYAILDDQSNVGFVSDGLCEQLGVQGAETTLKLTTMHTTTSIQSRKVCGLQVLDFKKENEIDLPPSFSRESVPAQRSQIPKGPDRLSLQDRVNYIPHTGVYHPRKPDKIRVVFDCSAPYQGVSLNDVLLQGPNTMNSLLGVLCRFRKEVVAVAADIKSMFHQFYVATEDRDLLRFLWWENGDPENAVVENRMKVHLFGAASSPGVATFGLRRAADDGENEYGTPAANYIRRDFYVDDGLRSEPDVASAIKLLKNSQAICAKAGLTLHKIASNARAVQESFNKKEDPTEEKDLGMQGGSTVERVLGVVWCIKNDIFKFKIELKERPYTRRGVLSTVSSFYDPCGFLSPVMLRGKQILQELCRSKLDWDSPMPGNLRPSWERWLQEVFHLEKLQIARCYKPHNFGQVKATEIHHFSDASQNGYGQCSYVRFVNTEDKAHCCFVIGKSRVTPLKQVSIPRLELTAATVSAKISSFLKQELKYDNIKEFFWTDSKVVLGYVQNEARRFHVYVANRIQLIRDLTDPDEWCYVDTAQNPADDASRGLSATQLTEDCRWLRGPEFLWTEGKFKLDHVQPQVQLEESDPELKRVTILKTGASDAKGHFEPSRLSSFSNWHRAKKAVARCMQLRRKLQSREVKVSSSSPDAGKQSLKEPVTVDELQRAERLILRSVQAEHFLEELQSLQKLKTTGELTDRQETRVRNAELKKTSCLYRLDPFLDEEGIIRVGGRIDRADVSRDIRHPIILPRKSHIAWLLINDCHSKVNHMGRGLTHNELRQRGYWLIGGSSAVSQFISQCVTCRKLRGSLVQQKMSELPKERVEPSAPFTYCAVDYFGPFLLKERRSEVKRYGVLFTCMSSRSIHLETANNLSSSSFINAFRRFMNRRGTIRQLRSDQGTTFIGARSELKLALQEMDQQQVQEYLLENGVEWIPFKLNVPHSSHMGGVWERQIHTVRRALDTVLAKAGSQLDDEAFRTFMTETECIVNSRPLTINDLSDSEAPEPLCPLHLLTMKPKVILPPPGKFQGADKYSRKWWRRVQYLANEFWLRWRREYLQQLQPRQKWTKSHQDLAIGDVVIVKENEDARLRWPLGRVEQVIPSEDGRVRKVKLLMADGALDSNGKRLKKPCYLDRPVHKLVLLLPKKE
ncbi:uncharacterized protein LOC121412484 [Lytechinus variegatus]|uniref:uncharacterized protein LOC121412484 n=1 Tax=Lytechinus variegatus TaxID=7654 RepID=UPI001BB287A2|nr:uncharacterized protein LOC121412484 [Lytechinus variegatus]